jgi:energy-coupling factor transport system permease protein
MDGRGFDSQRTRTTARISRFSSADAVLVGCSAALTAAAVTLAVLTGVWNPVFSS